MRTKEIRLLAAGFSIRSRGMVAEGSLAGSCGLRNKNQRNQTDKKNQTDQADKKNQSGPSTQRPKDVVSPIGPSIAMAATMEKGLMGSESRRGVSLE